MEITEVRVKLVSGKNDKLRAFCSITIDDAFVVRDLKVIDGVKGPFVAMPSRKRMDRCPRCGGKNQYRARYCNDCGAEVRRDGGRRRHAGEGDGQERSRLHAEIAHPINSRCRELVQRSVLEKYQEEMEKSKTPGYRSVEMDDDYDDYFEEGAAETPARSARAAEGLRPPRPAAAQPAFDEPRLAAGGERSPEEAEEPGRRLPGDRIHSGDEGATSGERRHGKEELEPEDNFGAGLL